MIPEFVYSTSAHHTVVKFSKQVRIAHGARSSQSETQLKDRICVYHCLSKLVSFTALSVKATHLLRYSKLIYTVLTSTISKSCLGSSLWNMNRIFVFGSALKLKAALQFCQHIFTYAAADATGNRHCWTLSGNSSASMSHASKLSSSRTSQS